MRKNLILRLYAVLSMLSLLVVTFVHILLNDQLLFHSDVYSLNLYLFSLAIMLATIFLGVLIPFFLKSNSKNNYIAVIALLIFVILLLIITLNGLDLLFKEYLRKLLIHYEIIDYLKNKKWVVLIYKVLIPVSIVIFSLLFIYGIVKHRHVVVERITVLSLFGFFFVVLALISGVLFNHGSKVLFSNNSKEASHLILFVIDAFPIQYTQTYGKNMPRSGFDEVFDRAYIFDNLYTSAPYTNGFFSVLYTGQPYYAKYGTFLVANDKTRHITYDNLLSRLNRADISTKVITFHGNGIPEWTSAKITEYKGLRSFFLTRKTTWLPRLLGLKYHVNVSRHGELTNAFFKHPSMTLFSLFSSYNTDTSERYIRYLIDEIEENRDKRNNSFTLVHLRFDASFELCVTQRPTFFDYFGKDLSRIEDFLVDEKNKLARGYEELLYQQMQCAGENFAKIIAALQEREKNVNSVIMVTADHGYLFDFETGRYGYSFHPEDEVVKVSLALLKENMQGRDKRLLSTPDLTHTILKYFNSDSSFVRGAVSFFEKDSEHEQIAVLTRVNLARKEWFLIIHDKSTGKWVLNIYEKGDAKVTKQLSDGSIYVVEEEELENIRPLINKAIREFSLEEENLHKKFLKS